MDNSTFTFYLCLCRLLGIKLLHFFSDVSGIFWPLVSIDIAASDIGFQIILPNILVASWNIFVIIALFPVDTLNTFMVCLCVSCDHRDKTYSYTPHSSQLFFLLYPA
jgi:hypothetical protein